MIPTVIIVSNLITLLATLPYVVGTIRGQQKPRVATWLVWAVLAGIGSAAAFSNHQIPAAIFTLSTGLEYGLVALLGFKYGDRTFGKLDIGCLLAAALGLALLIVVKSPVAAVTLVIVTDAVGTFPTFIHGWRHPAEESWVSFALFVVAEILTLAVGGFKDFTAFAYPAFFLVEDTTLLGIILLSPHKRVASIPGEGSRQVSETTMATNTLPDGTSSGNAKVPAQADSAPPALGAPLWASVDNGALKEILIPVASHNSGTIRGECFVGQFDPGVGNGTPIKCINGNLVIPVKAVLPAGSYIVQVRAMDTAGYWSELLPVQWTVNADIQAQPVILN